LQTCNFENRRKNKTGIRHHSADGKSALKLFCDVVINFQVMIAANDGLLDGPGFNSEESQLMSHCLHLLFRILLAMFAWYA